MPDANRMPGSFRYIITLFAVIASAAVAGMITGGTAPLISFAMAEAGYNATVIGLNASVSGIATILMAPFLPRLLQTIHTLPSMYLGLALALGSLLLFPWVDILPWWFLLRFAFGLGLSVHWVVSETWINAIVTERQRGRMMGIYVAALALGFLMGPILLRLVGTDGPTPFIWLAGLIAVASTPLIFTHGMAPHMPAQPIGRAYRFVLRSPVPFVAAIIGGFVGSTLLNVFPVYGIANGLAEPVIVELVIAGGAGIVIMQLPIGWLADHFDRQKVLIGCSAVGLIATIALPFLLGHPWLLWPTVFVWGGTIGALYTLGLTVLGHRFSVHQLSIANTAFVAMYQVGSMTGPPASGLAKDLWNPHGFVAAMAVAYALALAVNVYRAVHHPTPAGERGSH